MACNLSLLYNTLVIVVLMQFRIFAVVSQPQVPCYFIFGDSLVDSGNNNRLVTMAKANYPPYGIDFPQGVTGRFTNGRTIADLIGQELGFSKFISSFANATNADISTGVNYASGGAGIRDESGSNRGDVISLNMQLKNHAAIVSRLLLLQRNSTFTNEYVKKCIYLVNIGSSDYINNYLMPEKFPTSRIFTPDQYAAVLVNQLLQQLTTLYNLGARKVAVFGVGLIGCAPLEIARFGTNGTCVESINNEVQLFNDRLKPVVDNINNNLSDARFTFINVTSISAPDEDEPDEGFKVVQNRKAKPKGTKMTGGINMGKGPRFAPRKQVYVAKTKTPATTSGIANDTPITTSNSFGTLEVEDDSGIPCIVIDSSTETVKTGKSSGNTKEACIDGSRGEDLGEASKSPENGTSSAAKLVSDSMGSMDVGSTPIAEKIGKLEKLIIDGKATLVDDDGQPIPATSSTKRANPFSKVGEIVVSDSEDEVVANPFDESVNIFGGGHEFEDEYDEYDFEDYAKQGAGLLPFTQKKHFSTSRRGSFAECSLLSTEVRWTMYSKLNTLR